MISEELSPNTATFNTVIAALSEQRPDSKTSNNNPMWEKALAVYRVMESKHAPLGVAPNRQTYSMLIRSLSANLEPLRAEAMLANMRVAGFVPDVDLYTTTVRSYEKCGSPLKALRVMEAMREVGHDFYGIKVFDEAFKNGVRVLNLVGEVIGDEEGVASHAMSEETIDFDGDDYQLI
jgi:pentatricopeptide repeat protein